MVIAVAPLLEQDDHMFYQSAVIKRNVYFKYWDVDFDALKSFAIKMFTFHPALKNATISQQNEVLNTKSWNILATFVKGNLDSNFHIDGFYG